MSDGGETRPAFSEPHDGTWQTSIPPHLHRTVLALLAAASASAYLTRHCLAVASTTIQKELNINSAQMGLVFGLFALGYMFCQIPGGLLGARFGTRQALPWLSATWSLITIWTAFVFTLVPLAISRLAFGMAQAGLVPNTAQVIRDWFPSRSHGKVSAMIGVAMSLGAAVTMWLTGLLLEYMHWRTIFLAYSLVGIVWAIAFWMVFRTLPEQHPLVTRIKVSEEPSSQAGPPQPIETASVEAEAEAGTGTRTSRWKRIRRAFSNPAFRWMCIQAPFRAAGYNLFVTYFPEFLERAHGYTAARAGMLTTWPVVGVMAGGLMGGPLVDYLLQRTGNRTLSRSGVAFCALAITTALTVAATLAETPTQLLVLITLGATCSGIASPAIWTGLIDLGGRNTAIVAATSNMIGCLAGVLMTPLVGILVDAIKINGTGWDLLILVHAGFYACAAVSFLMVRIREGETV